MGPVDVTRGVAALGAQSAQATAAELRKRYESGKLRRELAAAAEAVTDVVPEVFQDAITPPAKRRRKRRRRTLLIVGVTVAGLAGGAVVFSTVRRSHGSAQPEPSPLPPSVEVAPKP